MSTAFRAILAGLSLLAIACSDIDLNTATTSERTAALPADTTMSDRYATDIDSLAALLPMVFSEMGWGLGGVHNEVTALAANGITATDRPIELRARQIDADTIVVQIRVGRFGDEPLEQQFQQTLRATLADATD